MKKVILFAAISMFTSVAMNANEATTVSTSQAVEAQVVEFTAIEISELPEAVVKKINETFEGGQIKSAASKQVEETTVYQVTVTKADQTEEVVTISAEGTIME